MPLRLEDKVKFKKEFLEEAKARFGLDAKKAKGKFTVKDFKFTDVLLQELKFKKEGYVEVPFSWLENA